MFLFGDVGVVNGRASNKFYLKILLIFRLNMRSLRQIKEETISLEREMGLIKIQNPRLLLLTIHMVIPERQVQ